MEWNRKGLLCSKFNPERISEYCIPTSGLGRYVLYPGKDLVELFHIPLFQDPVQCFNPSIFHKSLLFIKTIFRTPVLIMTGLISHLQTRNAIPKNFLQRFSTRFLQPYSQHRFKQERHCCCLVRPRQFFRVSTQFITCPPTRV